MKKIIIIIASSLFIAASSGSVLADIAKPTTTAACMGLLYQFSMDINAGKIPKNTVEAMQPKAKAMAGHCQKGKFDEAFALYTEITTAMGTTK